MLMVFIQNQSGRIGSISILAILFRQCLYEASSFSVYYSIPGDFKRGFSGDLFSMSLASFKIIFD